jgi:hypothetical protein
MTVVPRLPEIGASATVVRSAAQLVGAGGRPRRDRRLGARLDSTNGRWARTWVDPRHARRHPGRRVGRPTPRASEHEPERGRPAVETLAHGTERPYDRDHMGCGMGSKATRPSRGTRSPRFEGDPTEPWYEVTTVRRRPDRAVVRGHHGSKATRPSRGTRSPRFEGDPTEPLYEVTTACMRSTRFPDGRDSSRIAPGPGRPTMEGSNPWHKMEPSRVGVSAKAMVRHERQGGGAARSPPAAGELRSRPHARCAGTDHWESWHPTSSASTV